MEKIERLMSKTKKSISQMSKAVKIRALIHIADVMVVFDVMSRGSGVSLRKN